MATLKEEQIIVDLKDLIENSKLLNKRLILLLEELLRDNKAIQTANKAAMALKEGELSENDMVIFMNTYRSLKSASMGDVDD